MVTVLLATGCCKTIENSGTDKFIFPSIGVAVKDKAVLLAVDDYLLPFRRDMCYYISKPKVRKEPVLKPDMNDPNSICQLATHFYGTVLFDQGKYRMWYFSVFLKSRLKHGEPYPGIQIGPNFYAESNDGIHWTKPNLGQVMIDGSRNNNAIALPGVEVLSPNIIKDEDDPDPARRYKMVYNTWSLIRESKRLPTVRTAVSSDGINWTAGPERPVDDFVEQSSFYKYNDFYFINSQTFERREGGGFVGRQGYARISADFDNWIQGPAESFHLPQESPWSDSSGVSVSKASEEVHLGVGAASMGNVLVGLYGLWHNRPGPEGSESSGWVSGGTWSDLGLVVSNDGIHFREPVKGHVFISSKESEVTPAEGKAYPTILCQSNGIVNVGDETLIYHGRWRNASLESLDYYGEVALATLPRDRWGAVGIIPPLAGHPTTAEGVSEGWVWSAPVRLPAGGCEIFLNADDANCITMEISDERFNLLPEFSGEKCGTTSVKSGLDCPVIWAKSNPAALGGKTIRLRINFKKRGDSEPRLYAVYLKAKR